MSILCINATKPEDSSDTARVGSTINRTLTDLMIPRVRVHWFGPASASMPLEVRWLQGDPCDTTALKAAFLVSRPRMIVFVVAGDTQNIAPENATRIRDCLKDVTDIAVQQQAYHILTVGVPSADCHEAFRDHAVSWIAADMTENRYRLLDNNLDLGNKGEEGTSTWTMKEVLALMPGGS